MLCMYLSRKNERVLLLTQGIENPKLLRIVYVLCTLAEFHHIKYTENLQDEYGPQYLVVKVELTDWQVFVNFFLQQSRFHP
jgi:hypothetical protein